MESQNNLPSPPLCASGCGFYGSVENKNLCSKCFKENLLRSQKSMAAIEFSTPVVISDYSKVLLDPLPSLKENGSCSVNKQDSVLVNSDGSRSSVSKQGSVLASSHDSSGVDIDKKKRCQSCNTRVRLLGFDCRCGHVFCGDHRYPEKHSCTFDYKEMEREILTVKNPLVKADKLKDRS